jgi:hypothetical protein
MLRVTPFLSVPSCHGAVFASVCLLLESTHVGLTCVVGRWAWSPLAVKMMSVAGSGEWFVTLSTPHVILSRFMNGRHFNSSVV